MSLRPLLGAVAVVLLAGCTGSSSPTDPATLAMENPSGYTVSYRNQVRLPADGQPLSAPGFSKQTKARDPIGPIRCATDASDGFRDLATFLGGITWNHPVAIVKDASFPPLYTAKQENYGEHETSNAGAAASDSPASSAPVIERPDLVGSVAGTAIFLSKQHGLLAVDTRGPTPALSCSMKLPGEPKNFLFHGNEIVVVVNARNGFNRSALVRYAVENGSFRFVDAVRLEGQVIEDARLFDSTIVAYTSWTKTKDAPPPPPDDAPTSATSAAPSASNIAMTGIAAVGVASSPDRRGAKVIVVQWDDHLDIDWQDALLDDPAKQDPLEGTDLAKQYKAGDVVSERRTYKSFVSASDRYLVVPRDVQTTKFLQYATYSYQVCTSYNPHYEQVEQCHVNYEQRANPDYRAPNPSTGDYACNGKSLADCIQEAAPTVSQYVYAPVGQTCDMVWQGHCDKYETKTVTYPEFDTTASTEMTIYRFEDGSFTKLDSSLGKMVAKADAIAFEKNPLSVPGSIANRNQIQFQNGHVYVFADKALQTMGVLGNSISYLDRLDIEANTAQNPAIAFSADRAMISASTYNQSSQVAMIDLTTPSIPTTLNSFAMPGNTTQLILAGPPNAGGILGPGTVSFTNQGVLRNLQKLTLFSKDTGGELDNLLLGTEYNAFSSSYFDTTDDQRIRLSSDGTHLFLPYSGKNHADPYEPTAHRLNITRVDAGKLVSERSFDVNDDIIRTAAVAGDDQHFLAFANSSAYYIGQASQTTASWDLSVLRELFTPIATYRLDDANLYAMVSRVGSKCRITTHAGDASIFAFSASEALATADIPCGEASMPTGFGKNILFADTRTGVRIGGGGKTIDVLAAADVANLLTQAEAVHGYCYLASTPPTTEDAAASPQLVQFLDAVPAQVFCESR